MDTKKIEDTVVDSYKKVEDAFTGSYQKIEDKFVDTFLRKDDETIDNCLYTFYHFTSFEESIRKTIYMGGDTDTNACIVASLAGVLYKIDESLTCKTNQKIPEEFKKILTKAYPLNKLYK